MSLGHSWPFFFLLKRLYKTILYYIEAGTTDQRVTATIAMGVTADSAVTPTVIVTLFLCYNLCMIVMFLNFISCYHHSIICPTLKFK